MRRSTEQRWMAAAIAGSLCMLFGLFGLVAPEAAFGARGPRNTVTQVSKTDPALSSVVTPMDKALAKAGSVFSGNRPRAPRWPCRSAPRQGNRPENRSDPMPGHRDSSIACLVSLLAAVIVLCALPAWRSGVTPKAGHRAPDDDPPQA